MKPKDDLTFEFVYKILTYDCFDGEFRWSENPDDLSHMNNASAMAIAGKIAGGVYGNGYTQIQIKGKHYRAHRLAFLMTYERWPDGEIDHIDGNGNNNRIENLREVTRSENMRNQRISKDSTTGVTGVTFDKDKKRYMAHIKPNGKTISLGRFKTIEEAAAARQAANEKYGFHRLHGTVK